jgi:hypothetical protein
MPHIEFSFTTSTFIVLLLFVAAVAASLFIYRFTIPPVSRTKRILLTSLRSVALFLLLVFIFEPLLRLVFTSQQPPVVAVLMDNSKSMGITDRITDRKDELRRLFGSGPLKDLSGSAEARYYTFGATLKPMTSATPDLLSLNEDATDISMALRLLSTEREQQNIHAVLLATDGAYNLGQNPTYEAEALGIPCYTIGIGDSSEQKDVLVTRVAANDRVYNETQAPVDITVKSSGYSGENLEVLLKEGTKELDRRTITLGSGTREYPVRLSYTPQGEGLKKYTVKISALPGELTSGNNQKSFFAKVMKSKLKVLIVAGTPSPDLSTIKQTLTEDKNLDVRSFTQKLPGGFYEGALLSQPFDSADCIVLIGFPTSSTNSTMLDFVTSAVVHRSKPVLFIGGRSVGYGKLQALASILPFTALNISTTEDYVFFQPSDAQRWNPILAIHQSEGLNVWNRLPPIFKTQTSFKARPEATVLGFPRVRGIVLNEPLIVTRNVNRQKSLAVLGYGLWRWRLMTQGTLETEQLLSIFLSNSIKWLTTDDDSRPVKVTTTKESYTQGEPVEFMGQVYDAAMQPVDDTQLRVTVRQGDKETGTVLRPIGNGRYEGSIDGLGEGDYTFRASAQADGQQLGVDNGRFTVGEINLEFRDTRMNSTLLRQIAHRTGGHYYTTKELETLVRDIVSQPSFSSRESVRTKTVELWNWQYSLAAVILLLGAEWFIRKRSGML